MSALRVGRLGLPPATGGGGGGLSVITQGTEPDATQVPDGTAAIWVDSSSGTVWWVVRIGGTLKKTEAA